MTQTNCPECSKRISADSLRCMRCGAVLAELPAEDFVGGEIGDVLIEQELRKSAYSITLAGTQKLVGRPVLLKLLGASRLLSEPPKSLLREMQALSQLRHANILTLYNVGLHDKRYPYMVTERLQGGSVRDVLDAAGPMSPLRALGVIQQVASALEEVHRKQIVHQNLNPTAISLEELAGSRQLLAKISDFRVARLEPLKRGEAERLDTLEVSPAYMSPEQVLGADIDDVSDLYSVGVILYEMLTGELPYGLDSGSILDQIVSETPAPLVTKAPALAAFPQIQALLDKLLQKKPSARLSNARSLRLLATRIREDLVALGASDEGGADAFPVLETAARLRPVRAGQSADAAPAAPPPPPKVGSVPMRRPQPAAEQPALVDTAEIDGLEWRAIVPARLARAKGAPYLVLAAVGIGDDVRVGNDFASGAEVLLASSIGEHTRFAATTVPDNPAGWLRRIVQRAKLDGVALGVAYVSQFPGGQGQIPSMRSTRAALEAARQGGRGWLLLGEHAVASLSLQGDVVTVEYDHSGRPTTLLRFS